MSLDKWIDGGIGGGARQQHDEGLSDGRRTHTQSLAGLTPTQEAELAVVEREKAEMRRRMGLMPEQRFDELVSWLLGPRPEER